ncbi:AbrB family transcriptional regulator [Sulfitobacter sp. THAF37]|uniref:AbrB family transcriptional regulator n=1 Tax=Sulfitobacter sp. THAF37 TaxID=2587855 RepID=UPI0020C7CA3D|nr:AbrB family transcriptional regulator [Sulfitobacter sp. THAF37]
MAALVGIPAGALIGSTLAVAAVAATRYGVGLPPRLRDVAFATIGVSLGAGVDEGLIGQLETWAASLVILLGSLVATILVGRVVLMRWFGLDGKTATLASAPGTMSNAVAIASEGHGDAKAVMILQLVRLVFLAVAVPPLAVALNGSAGGSIADDAAMSVAVFIGLLAVSTALGLLGGRVGLPAASLLAGMIVSAGLHGVGLIDGPSPPWAIFAAFAVTGAVISTRMSNVTARDAKRYAVAGLAMVGVSLVTSLAFALLAQAVTRLELGQILIAYAPGGVEAMAAIGLSLGYDPTYVAVHHFARIFALVVIVPVVLKMAER